MKCNGCDLEAIIRYKILPYSETLMLWDSTPRDVLACRTHIEDAKRIGTVLSATPLSDDVVTRVVQ